MQTDIQTKRLKEIKTYRLIDRHIERQNNRWKDKQTDGKIYRQTERLIDIKTYRLIDIHIYRHQTSIKTDI